MESIYNHNQQAIDLKIKLIFDKILKRKDTYQQNQVMDFTFFVSKFYYLLGLVKEIQVLKEKIDQQQNLSENNQQEGRENLSQQEIQLAAMRNRARDDWMQILQSMQDNEEGIKLLDDVDFFLLLDYTIEQAFLFNNSKNKIIYGQNMSEEISIKSVAAEEEEKCPVARKFRKQTRKGSKNSKIGNTKNNCSVEFEENDSIEQLQQQLSQVQEEIEQLQDKEFYSSKKYKQLWDNNSLILVESHSRSLIHPHQPLIPDEQVQANQVRSEGSELCASQHRSRQKPAPKLPRYDKEQMDIELSKKRVHEQVENVLQIINKSEQHIKSFKKHQK